MAFTLFAILFLVAIALSALVVGHYMGHVELYFLGVIIMLFAGLILISDGFEREEGHVREENRTESPPDGQNETDTAIDEVLTITRESVQNRWTDAFGLLLIVIGAGASLTYFRERKRARRAAERSLEVRDDF